MESERSRELRIKLRLTCFSCALTDLTNKLSCNGHLYSYFEKGCRKQKCTRQSRKVIWDMINTLFLTLQLSNLLLLHFFSTRKQTSMTCCTILSNFFEEQGTQNRPTIPFGIVACTFSYNLSRNSCIQTLLAGAQLPVRTVRTCLPKKSHAQKRYKMNR